MALRNGKKAPNGPQHTTAVTNYLVKHGPDARRERAQLRRQQRQLAGPEAQLRVLDTRPGKARRERSRLNRQLAAA